MKSSLLILIFFLTANFCHAQYFQATLYTEGNDLVVKIRPNSGGGNITTDWSDIEFIIRWADGSPAFTFGTVTMNTTDFPNVPLFQRNLPNNNGQEIGYANAWFGSSFTVTPFRTYTAGTEYEVFRVTLNVLASTIDFELIHNTTFTPTYLALTSGTGAVDRSNPTGNKFYGTNTTICTNCPSSTAGSNHVGAASVGALPIELTFFKARAMDKKKAQLFWQTASEENNDYFTIERSADGVRFEFLENVSGAGSTYQQSDYMTYDKAPLDGINYYRLKQTDFDGAFEYSQIEVLTFENDELDFQIFPNPTSDKIHIRFNENLGKGNIKIFSSAGQLVKMNELNPDNFQQTVNLNDLPQGIYWLRVQRKGTNYDRKIIVQ